MELPRKKEKNPYEQMRTMRSDPEGCSCKNYFPHQTLLRASYQRVKYNVITAIKGLSRVSQGRPPRSALQV